MDGPTACDMLQALRFRAQLELGVPDGAQITLCLGTHNFGREDDTRTLSELGIGDGAELLCVVQQWLVAIRPNLRVHVSGAGVDAVDGVYRYNGSYFENENDDIATTIAWYGGSESEWTPGWYINYHPSADETLGVYYQSTCSFSCLPMEDWKVYDGTLASPDNIPPAPRFELFQ
jgi:hypothetical protein